MARDGRPWRTASLPADAGNAVVEFLGGSLVLLVPLVYLVTALAAVQQATFAVDGAAREAARAAVTSPATSAQARTVAAVGLALADQGLDADLAAEATSVRCDPDCTGPRSTVTVRVDVEVPLPLVPRALGDLVPLTIPVSGSVTAPVDTFRSAAGPTGDRP